jgi:autoinducer 2-degrading protein
MTFDPVKIEDFLANFNANKKAIRNFEGCKHLELLQDADDSNVYFTYSHWLSKDHLESYRSSALFKEVWSRTKPLFLERPQAWSIHQVMMVAKN